MYHEPQAALNIAKGLVSANGDPLIDIQATTEAFLMYNHIEETTAFLIGCSKG